MLERTYPPTPLGSSGVWRSCCCLVNWSFHLAVPGDCTGAGADAFAGEGEGAVAFAFTGGGEAMCGGIKP